MIGRHNVRHWHFRLSGVSDSSPFEQMRINKGATLDARVISIPNRCISPRLCFALIGAPSRRLLACCSLSLQRATNLKVKLSGGAESSPHLTLTWPLR